MKRTIAVSAVALILVPAMVTGQTYEDAAAPVLSEA